MSWTISSIPREEKVEAIFSKLLSSPAACTRLMERFYDHLNEENIVTDSDPEHFTKILFSAYENQDVSALLLELCQKSMFDLLREAYLIPMRFHGKAGRNPVLLTDADGNAIDGAARNVPRHELSRLRDIQASHTCIPQSRLYLADGYDIDRAYTDGLEIEETLSNRRRGILALYALPDTAELGLSEAQAYAMTWDAFCRIQRTAPAAMVYYGQETGERDERSFDELGVLLPIHRFEGQLLSHLETIDSIVLELRGQMNDKTY